MKIISSNLCYVHPSVEFLGLTIKQFSNQDPRSHSFQMRTHVIPFSKQIDAIILAKCAVVGHNEHDFIKGRSGLERRYETNKKTSLLYVFDMKLGTMFMK